LLSIDELQRGDDIWVADLLDKAERQLGGFDGMVDTILGFRDFPVITMVPVLCRSPESDFGSLEAVLRCEHNYWSRLVQREVTTRWPGSVWSSLGRDDGPPERLSYSMWVKPVKALS